MEKGEIIKAVMEKEYQISPEAVELIKSSNSSESLLKYVLSTVDDSVIVIGTEHIDIEGFAANGGALKLIYVENKENPGFETSVEKLHSDEVHVSAQGSFLKAGKLLSESRMISSGSNELSLESDMHASVPLQDQETYKNFGSEFIPIPDKASESISDSKSVPDVQSDNDSFDEVSDSYLASESLSSLRTVPESVFSPPARRYMAG